MNIHTHKNFSLDDLMYLRAKGWTDAEIVARWDEESARGNGPCQWKTPEAQAKLRSAIRNARQMGEAR
jgi:hypothetical protein